METLYYGGGGPMGLPWVSQVFVSLPRIYHVGLAWVSDGPWVYTVTPDLSYE